jgi:hypothetical protein
MNYDDENGYHLTDEEVYNLAKQELIDKINRVPFAPSEAASKGTALNAIIDGFVTGKRSEEVEMKGDIKMDTITACVDGFTFSFSYSFCQEVANYFKGCLCQVLVEAPIETKYGVVLLYGYPDYIRENKVFDLKTTGRYEFGKYKEYSQRYVYPYCLIESGGCTGIENFEFTAYKMGTRKGLIYGTQYPEVYKYNHDEAKTLLRQKLERFIEFLEDNRNLITDRKIFGGDEH